MGEALFDLEQLLKSQKEALTLEEASILQTCKFKAVRQFTAGVITGSSVALEATWKLSRFAQANISGGNAIKALDDCLLVDIMKPGADAVEDPLESIFGFMAPVEEIHHPGASGKPARVLNRSQKRSHRRHQMRPRETSLDSEHLQTV